MKNQKDKRQILSSNLREFDLKEALNHAKKEKGAEVLAKNSQDMSDYILDCDQILSEATKTPFTYIYKVLKADIHAVMSVDKVFRDNVACLIRSEMIKQNNDSKQKDPTSGNHPLRDNIHPHAHEDGRANTDQHYGGDDTRAASRPIRDPKLDPNAPIDSSSRFIRDMFREYGRHGEGMKAFKNRWYGVTDQGQDPRLVFRNDPQKKNLPPHPRRGGGGGGRGGKFRHSGGSRGRGNYSHHGHMNPYQRYNQHFPPHQPGPSYLQHNKHFPGPSHQPAPSHQLHDYNQPGPSHGHRDPNYPGPSHGHRDPNFPAPSHGIAKELVDSMKSLENYMRSLPPPTKRDRSNSDSSDEHRPRSKKTSKKN